MSMLQKFYFDAVKLAVQIHSLQADTPRSNSRGRRPKTLLNAGARSLVRLTMSPPVVSASHSNWSPRLKFPNRLDLVKLGLAAVLSDVLHQGRRQRHREPMVSVGDRRPHKD